MSEEDYISGEEFISMFSNSSARNSVEGIQSYQSSPNSSGAGEKNSSAARVDEEDVSMERDEYSISPITCRRNSTRRNLAECEQEFKRRRNSADRNPVESIQSYQSSLNSSAAGEYEEDARMEGEKSSFSPHKEDSSVAGEDEEDQEDVRMEREENPISPFTCRRNSSGRNPVERIQSLQSSLKSAFDEYGKQFHDMEADLATAKRHKRELAERNKKLAEKLRKAKEQSSKKFQDMEAKLGKAELVNRNLDKRNKKLEEKFHKARGQYWKKVLDIKTELVTAKSQKEELIKINNALEEQHCKEKERVHEINIEYLTLLERNNKIEEELNRAKERENSSKRNLQQTRNKLQELYRTFAAVTEECDQVCKQQEQTGAAPHLSKKKKYVLKVYELNDWVNCSICLEPWTESGQHNACSLSCGHFFGRSCITQWISRNGSGCSSTCPVCSNRATLSDIRHHYVSQIYDGKEKFEQAD